MIAKYRGRIRPEAIEALEIAFGVDSDRTVFQQYIDYLKRMVTGDFGISVTFYPANVSEVLSQSIFWTIGLLGLQQQPPSYLVFAWVFGRAGGEFHL